MQSLLQWKSSNTYSECVFVDSGTKQAMCMQHILICGLALQYFSTLSHKWHDLKKKFTEQEIVILILSTTFV